MFIPHPLAKHYIATSSSSLNSTRSYFWKWPNQRCRLLMAHSLDNTQLASYCAPIHHWDIQSQILLTTQPGHEVASRSLTTFGRKGSGTLPVRGIPPDSGLATQDETRGGPLMHCPGLLPVVSYAPCTDMQHGSLTCVRVAGGGLARSSSVGRPLSQNQTQTVATRRTMPVKIRTTSMATPVTADSGASLSRTAILARGRSYFKLK